MAGRPSRGCACAGAGMSLVGSLEDLGLGDILQIISLSRKSGRLLLRSSEGEGRIIFEQGLVRAAFLKGEPEDLRGLLVSGGFVDAEDIDRAVDVAQSAGLSTSPSRPGCRSPR